MPITLPAAQPVTPGTTDISLTANEKRTLAAGSYRNVSVISGNGGQKTILTLSGGTYQFTSISVVNDARIECATACEIRVRDRVALGNRSYIGPKPGVFGLGSGNVQLFVNGANGASGPLGTPHAVLIGDDSELHAYALVPNGTLRLGHRVVFRGKLVGKDVVIGNSDNAEGRQLAIITTNPMDQVVRERSSARFEVVATGPGLTYQWRRNGSNIANANGPSYTTPPTVLSQTGDRFSVLIINNAGTVVSGEAKLTVLRCTDFDLACDGQDEDCDNVVDDDVAPICSGAVVRTCQGGQMRDFQNCVDADLCNGAETCSNGACVDAPDLANYTNCSTDNNDCNGEELCYNGVCSYFPHVPVDPNCGRETCDDFTHKWDTFYSDPGTSCSDGDDTNGREVCDADGLCYAPPQSIPGAECDPLVDAFCDPWTSRASGAAPCPNAPTSDGQLATKLSCLDAHEAQPDKTIFVFLSGICDAGTKQSDGPTAQSDDPTDTDPGLISEWSQYPGEGFPVTGDVDGISFNSATGRGAELAQLIMNSSSVWVNSRFAPDEGQWESPVDGEAVFYRVPWPCHIGYNAGAIDVARKLDTILTREFGPLEEGLLTEQAQYNPRQLFIVAHSGGGPLSRLLLANWGHYDAEGMLHVLPPGDARRENLTTLINFPAELAAWPADPAGIAPATPAVPKSASEIEEFMAQSTRIRRHTAGVAMLTSPVYGSPVSRLASSSFVKVLGDGNSSMELLDEAYMAVLHGPGMPFDDALTYPGLRPALDLPGSAPVAGIPVLLVGGRSSEPKVTNEDLVEYDLDDTLSLTYPLADRWISEWRWREPLTQACQVFDEVLCSTVLVPGFYPLCQSVLDTEAHNAPNNVSITLRDYMILGCEAAVWFAESPAFVAMDGEFDPFRQFSTAGLECGLACAAVDGISGDDPTAAAFCNGQCQCIVNDQCDLDNPATWWCCDEDVADELLDRAGGYVDDIYGLLTKSLRKGCSVTPACVAPCGTSQLDIPWIDEEADELCHDCIDTCVAPLMGDLPVSEIIDLVSDQLGIEFPGAEQIAAWESLMSPQTWSSVGSYTAAMESACLLADWGALPEDTLGSAEPRFGTTPLMALCDAMATPDFLSNGWAGDMFEGRHPGDVATTCGANLDATSVDYGSVRENTINQGVEYVYRLLMSTVGGSSFDSYPWDTSELYDEGADGSPLKVPSSSRRRAIVQLRREFPLGSGFSWARASSPRADVA